VVSVFPATVLRSCTLPDSQPIGSSQRHTDGEVGDPLYRLLDIRFLAFWVRCVSGHILARLRRSRLFLYAAMGHPARKCCPRNLPSCCKERGESPS
jgi:hypothetical protein